MKTLPKAWCLPENLQDFAESKWLESHGVLAANATLVPAAFHHPSGKEHVPQAVAKLPNIKISSGSSGAFLGSKAYLGRSQDGTILVDGKADVWSG